MERELLYQKIYDDLLQGIRDNVYPPGSRLPSEKELAEQYHVSRITSKKALEMLADQKIIFRMPGKGSFVQDAADLENEPEEPEEVPHPLNVGTRKLIGVVLDDFSSSFGSEIVHGIEAECRKKSYFMLLRCTYGSLEEETRAINDLIAIGVDGIILLCVQGETYNANILKLVLDNYPIVLVDREMAGLPIPCICTDNYTASKELMQVLFERGHKNIAFISHPFLQTTTVTARFEGYKDSILEHGYSTNESMWIRDIHTTLPTIDEQPTEESADLDRIRTFIKENPEVTGFFAVDQSLGGMVYSILEEMGQSKEKEVVFFDGILSNYPLDRKFSYIMQGQYMMGIQAVKVLRRCFKGEEVPRRHYVPYTLVRGK